jgi:hypothetical protein
MTFSNSIHLPANDNILNKQKCLFSKTENKKVKQLLSRVGISGMGENIRKGCRRINEYGANIIY